ncbi:unnamed protein product [Arctogadus glacialis]
MKEQAALGGAGMVGLWRLMEQEEHDEGTFPVSGPVLPSPRVSLSLLGVDRVQYVSQNSGSTSRSPAGKTSCLLPCASASSPVTVVSWTLVGVHAPPLEDARKHQGDDCPRVYQGPVGSTNQGCSPDTGL